MMAADIETGSQDAAGNDVRSAYAELLRRRRFLWRLTLLEVVLILGIGALMACIEPSTAGPKVYLASRVVGYAGHVVAVCWGLFIVYQWTLSAKELQRILDSIK
ncbi:hypothetical protein CFC21_020551 [Triticum aestivum]|uniref:Uncharacterized protein n=2 Tax=Triticum aestivum TaxID=4565 RepID=A0A3B6BWS3_WHEAT|nr:hypothetical protein CFC21_020551 [Triticum aestivum]